MKNLQGSLLEIRIVYESKNDPLHISRILKDELTKNDVYIEDFLTDIIETKNVTIAVINSLIIIQRDISKTFNESLNDKKQAIDEIKKIMNIIRSIVKIKNIEYKYIITKKVM